MQQIEKQYLENGLTFSSIVFFNESESNNHLILYFLCTQVTELAVTVTKDLCEVHVFPVTLLYSLSTKIMN